MTASTRNAFVDALRRPFRLGPAVGLVIFVAVHAACLHRPADEPTAADPPGLKGGADLHAHLTLNESLPVFAGAPDGPALASSPDDWLTNPFTTAGIRRAGLKLIVATVWPPFELRPGMDAMDEAIAGADALKRFVATHPGYAIAGSAEEAQRLMARDLIVLIPHLEGAEAIQSVDDVDRLFAAGYRSIGLVHFTRNAIAGAHPDQFGPLLGHLLNGRDEGLSPLGREAVQRMIALGMLIDVGHCNARTIDDVLALAEAAGVPIVDSHVGPDWASPQTLSDAHARRIAALGGLIGVGVYRYDGLMSAPEEARWEDFAPTTCDDTVALWLHFATLVGAEHVVLGSDLGSAIHRPRAGGLCPHGLRHVGDLPELYAALTQKGFPRTALESGASRILRLFERVEAHADQAARRGAAHRRLHRAHPLDAPL